MGRQTSSIDPLYVAAYLQAAGWTRGESFCEDKASLWFAPGDDRKVDVLLPKRTTLGDYELRMDELLREVAAVEGRTPGEVLEDLRLVNADVLHLRVSGFEGAELSVPFRQGVRLLRSLEDVFTAAALAAIEKRTIYTNRKVERVTDYMAHLRLGHTGRSSFVFTAISMLSPSVTTEPGTVQEGHSGPNGGAFGEGFERQVTHTLMQALKAIEETAKNTKPGHALEAFRGAVQAGVSANLCDAIVELTETSPSPQIEFSMRWAPICAKPSGLAGKVVFKKKNIRIIEEAGDAFWGMSKDHDTRVEGVVTAVDASDRNGAVSATIAGYINGRARQIRAFFGSEHLGELMRAYESRDLVKCEGDIVREQGRYILKNGRYLEFVSP